MSGWSASKWGDKVDERHLDMSADSKRPSLLCLCASCKSGFTRRRGKPTIQGTRGPGKSRSDRDPGCWWRKPGWPPDSIECEASRLWERFPRAETARTQCLRLPTENQTPEWAFPDGWTHFHRKLSRRDHYLLRENSKPERKSHARGTGCQRGGWREAVSLRVTVTQLSVATTP